LSQQDFLQVACPSRRPGLTNSLR